jgi:iron complex outermembrane receptor protein
MVSVAALLAAGVIAPAGAQSNVTPLPAVAVDAPREAPRVAQRRAVPQSVSYRRAVARRPVSSAPQQISRARGERLGAAATSAAGASLGGPATIAAGYVPQRTSAGMRSDTPILEIPQSISVVTRQQLDDRNVQTLSQALDYTASVRAGAFGFDPRFDSFYMRGFDMTYVGVYRDGLRQPAGPFSIYKTEPYGLDAIVAVKGPSSSVYGLGSPGGLVDLQTKRPPLEAMREIQLQIGNHDRYQGNFDIGGPIDPQGVYAYRLTGMFRDSNTWLPGVKDNRDYIAPAFAWRPDESTSLTILGEYMQSRTTGNAAFYQTPEGVLTRYYGGDPSFTNFDQDQFRIGYELEHRFDESVTFVQNARYAYVKYTSLDFIDFDTGVGSRSTGRIIDHLSTFALDNRLHVKFATGPVEHKILGGLEYTNAQYDDKKGFGAAPDVPIYPYLPYGALPIAPPPDYPSRSSQKQDQFAFYAQDQAKWDSLILTLSGREDVVSIRTNDEVVSTDSRQRDSAFSGRAGLTWLAPFGFAPYANYGTSFAPTIGTDASGAAFRPITGEQKEFGVKFRPEGVDLLLQAAWFDILQSHAQVPDPNNPAFMIQTGAVRSRGVELEALANPAPGWKVSLSYTHLDLKFVSGSATNPSGELVPTNGKSLSGIPQDTFSGWVGYTIQPGHALAGLGAGFGLRYIGPNFGDDTNAFRTPSTTMIDANLHYDLAEIDPALKGVRLQVNGQNLADSEYVTCQSGYCYRGPRRTVIGSVRYRF